MQAILSSKLINALRPALRPMMIADFGFALRQEAPQLLLGWLVVGALYFAAAGASLVLAQLPVHADTVWLPNGLLLAVLLLSPRRLWTGYLTAGFLASLLAHGVFHISFLSSLVFSVANTVEVLIPAQIMRSRSSFRPDLSHWKTLRRFLGYAVLLAPLCWALIAVALRTLAARPTTLQTLGNWTLGDAVGIAWVTPAILAIERTEVASLFKAGRRLETIGLLLGLTLLAVLVFAQSRYTLGFLLVPALLLVVVRLRGSGSAIGVLLIAIPAIWLTAQDRGSFSASQTGSLASGMLLLQCFLCVLLVVVYAVSAALAERDRLQRDILEAYHQADVMAGLDHMTGLANRRTFDKELSREWRRAVRERTSLSLLMVDIDYFKLYNDHYGHVAGDECLRTIAALLAKTMVRSNDLAARYGGEEFAIILPGSNAEGALMIAERLRDTIARANLRHDHSSRGTITVSIGVASAVPLRTMDETQLVQAADKALYLAKRNGRNLVAVSTPYEHDSSQDSGNNRG